VAGIGQGYNEGASDEIAKGNQNGDRSEAEGSQEEYRKEAPKERWKAGRKGEPEGYSVAIERENLRKASRDF
jgi:hypothetical protein